jgi:hypothetical protein
MAIRTEADVAIGPPGALARPDWRAGGAFTAGELRLEQTYRRQRLRRHLRLVHGWGVVCGLNLVAANDGDGWDLFVCPGYGIGPCGDEIIVQRQFRFSLRDYMWTRPVGAAVDRAWIGIEAADEPAAYQPVAPAVCGCDCGHQREAVSRLVDGFRLIVWWTPPVLPWGGFDVCSGAAPTCPRCPETCGLPLASVALRG